MDPDKIITGLTKELDAELKTMSKTKDIDAKEAHSRIIKNLCQSLGVFFDLMSEMMPYEPYEPDDDLNNEDIPF
nr:hypothetical protein [uncultured Desulfobacter sp.]